MQVCAEHEDMHEQEMDLQYAINDTYFCYTIMYLQYEFIIKTSHSTFKS